LVAIVYFVTVVISLQSLGDDVITLHVNAAFDAVRQSSIAVSDERRAGVLK